MALQPFGCSSTDPRPDGCGWGYLLAFADPLGHVKTWAMPARMLSADGGEYRATLLNMGLRIATTPRARTMLTQYIQTRTPAEFASCTDRIGWHGRAFVLPKETIGDDAERIVFQSENAVENTFRVKGTADQWRERVGACVLAIPAWSSRWHVHLPGQCCARRGWRVAGFITGAIHPVARPRH
jgi:hypothetical protein